MVRSVFQLGTLRPVPAVFFASAMIDGMLWAEKNEGRDIPNQSIQGDFYVDVHHRLISFSTSKTAKTAMTAMKLQ